MYPVKGSIYWYNEIIKTEDELAQIINGDLSSIKQTKTDTDTITQQDIDKLVSVKYKYLSYCRQRYEEEKAIEDGVDKKPAKSILYFDREFGY